MNVARTLWCVSLTLPLLTGCITRSEHDKLMAEKGLYYNLFMSQFKGKGPGGEVDTSGFVST